MTLTPNREHLYRCHALPIHCLRCHSVFATEELLRAHSLSDTPCQKRPSAQPFGTKLEGIGLSQERRLRSRKRSNKTEEQKWSEVYRICFPDDVTVPSACAFNGFSCSPDQVPPPLSSSNSISPPPPHLIFLSETNADYRSVLRL